MGDCAAWLKVNVPPPHVTLKIPAPDGRQAKGRKSSKLLWAGPSGFWVAGSFMKDRLGLMRISVWFEQNPEVLGGVAQAG